MNPKISVIVPVYNVEFYLEEALNSLINQTIHDKIEVLMIDDGSDDNSRYIIEKYALDYDNFYAYHNNNEGLGSTRNYGLNLIRGEYIHFMDSDDYIPPDFYERLYETITENSVDFVSCNILRLSRYNLREDILFKMAFKDLDKPEIYHSLEEAPSLLWDTSSCNKLFKKDFIMENNLRFMDGKLYYEDLLFSLKSYSLADSFIILNDVYYYWRIRQKTLSITQQKDSVKSAKDRIFILKLCQEFMHNRFNKLLLETIYYKWLHHDFKLFLSRINNYPSDDLKKFLKEINHLIDYAPSEIYDKLNSFEKILYQLVAKEDIKGLLEFAPLENSLKKNLGNYIDVIDYKNDSLNENLKINKKSFDFDDDRVYINFEYNINYFPDDYPHNIEAYLVDGENNEYPLEINLYYNQIIIPVSMIQKDLMKIKLKYICDLFEKSGFLLNDKRKTLSFKNFDVNLGIGKNKEFYINSNKTDENEIEITDIQLNNDKFIFRASSKYEIENVFIENVLNFKKIRYPVLNRFLYFTFEIPINDIINTPIKKWELKTDLFNKFTLSKTHTFYFDSSKIFFKAIRNKILISSDLFDLIEYLNKTNKKNKQLKYENKNLNKKCKNLTDKNKSIENEINEYKSRKDVSTVEKFKSAFKK